MWHGHILEGLEIHLDEFPFISVGTSLGRLKIFKQNMSSHGYVWKGFIWHLFELEENLKVEMFISWLGEINGKEGLDTKKSVDWHNGTVSPVEFVFQGMSYTCKAGWINVSLSYKLDFSVDSSWLEHLVWYFEMGLLGGDIS